MYRMPNRAVAENDINKQIEEAYIAAKKYSEFLPKDIKGTN